MKKRLVFYLLIIFLTINFLPTYATKNTLQQQSYLPIFSTKSPPYIDGGGKSRKSKSSRQTKRQIEQYVSRIIAEPEIEKNTYNHDAYTSLPKFTDRWYIFQEYFKTLISVTHFTKYFCPGSQALTLNVNETIRKSMKPTEYLHEVEKMLLSGKTLNSQATSEIISKELSELGFENYILQYIPGEIDRFGTPETDNCSKWVVLYRGFCGNWYVVDFSAAMEAKFDMSKSVTQSLIIPFATYMEQLINLADAKNMEWCTALGTLELRNTVMINFTPGFCKQSDDYQMCDIVYLPFDYFVAFKLAIEQIYGPNQHVAQIRYLMDQLNSKPNYKILERSPEIIKKMYEYMLNYLSITE